MILMNLVLLALLFPSVTLLFWNKSTEQHQQQLSQTLDNLRISLKARGASLSRSIALSAKQALAGYDYSFLTHVISQVVNNDSDISYCLIEDLKGTAIIHSTADLIGSKPDAPLDRNALSLIKGFPENPRQSSLPVSFIEATDKPLIEAITPLYLGDRLWGGLRCGISLQQLNASIQQAEKQRDQQIREFTLYFISIGLIFLVIGISIALFFTRLLVNSLDRLSKGVQRVSSGDLSHRIETGDLLYSEFTLLAESFNQMTGNLLESRKTLDEYNRSLEKKVAQRTSALEAAQKELLKHARESGMAEIAQGVMHNIGNALTPLKTSAQVTFRNIHESNLRGRMQAVLTDICNIIETSDHTDKARLLQIINLVPEVIEDEYRQTEEQLLRMNESIEHIEGIIHLQAKYTRISGRTESLAINDVIRDALDMMDDSLKKHGVTTDMELARLPPLECDKNQLLQVFLNLIKNAIEAMVSIPMEHRRLLIATQLDRSDATENIVITFQDTGCGIDDADQQRIFGFGYTTKASGTGVGLHASANFIISCQGRLEVTSPGKNRGATFTIILPVRIR